MKFKTGKIILIATFAMKAVVYRKRAQHVEMMQIVPANLPHL